MSNFQTIYDRFANLRKSMSQPATVKKSDLTNMLIQLQPDELISVFTYENQMYMRMLLDGVNKMQAILYQTTRTKNKLMERQTSEDGSKFMLHLKPQLAMFDQYYRTHNKSFDHQSFSKVFELWECLSLNIGKMKDPDSREVFSIIPNSDQYQFISDMMVLIGKLHPDFLTRVTTKAHKEEHLVMALIKDLYQLETRSSFQFGQYICLLGTITLLYICNIEDRLVNLYLSKPIGVSQKATPSTCFADRIQINRLIIDCDLLQQPTADEVYTQPRRLWNHQYLTSEVEDLVLSDAFQLMERTTGRRRMSFDAENDKKPSNYESTLNRMDIHYTHQIQQSHFGMVVPPLIPSISRKEWM